MSTEDGRQTFTTSDGREIPRPRKKKKARLPDRYDALINGQLDISDLDEQELFEGRLRGNDGHFRGVPPKVIPWSIHKAYVDHVGSRLERTIIQSMPDIVQGLIDIATGGIHDDTGIAMDVRAKAQMYLVDRILGRPTERKEVGVNVTAKWEQAFDSGSLLVDIPEGDIIDAELVEEGASNTPPDRPALPESGALVEPPGGTPGRDEDGVAAQAPQAESAPRPRKTTGVKL